MVIPRLFLERTVIHTPKGYRVAAHTRPRLSIFTRVRYHYFPTLSEAEEWMRQRWIEGRGTRSTLTTQSVLWVTDGLMPVLQYKLPTMTTERTDDGKLTVWLNGFKVATDAHTGRDLKRQLLNHTIADCLSVNPCPRCGRMPKVNLHLGTLEHRHDDCILQIKMVRDTLTPPPMQIAVWNNKISRRIRPTRLIPMTRPHFMILGALREPTEHDFAKRIRKFETYTLDV
jgi:hypothetical protein